MTLIQRFEDIRAWQEARMLTRQVYEITRLGRFARDFGMKDQIQRAAVSTMSNVAEGFDCESKAEFARFLSYARRSAVEVQSILYTALDVGYITEDELKVSSDQAGKAKALIGAFKHSLAKRR